MKVGFVGLGRMGSAMVRRLLKHKHKVVAYDRNPEAVRDVVSQGAAGADSLGNLVEQLSAPRVVWLMVPSGDPVSAVLRQIEGHLKKGDIVIDGGNSNYRDSIARAKDLKEDGIHYLDAGTSGGIWGLELGYCLMVGGERSAFKKAEPLFRDLAPKKGYAYVGPSGAGHFVKMVHNGIEYAMLQAYGEGFEMMERSEFNLDLHQLASLWNHGGVIRSWLLELAESALEKDAHLGKIRAYVSDSGEGRWTVQDAIDRAVPVPTIAQALFTRFRSRQEESFSDKLIAALRQEFGGHAVKKKKR